MPLNFFRCFLLLTMLVSLQGMAQQVPVRGLLAEQADAGQGAGAIVHTYYGTAYGFFLSNENEVLVSRHSVLTPQRTIADKIDVKYPQLPFDNFVESRSVPIAQDLVHDLLLLRIVNAEGTETTKAVAPPPSPAPAATPVAVPACTPLRQARHHRHRAQRHSYLRQARYSRGRAKASLRHALVFRPYPQLHIVWDGPAASSR